MASPKFIRVFFNGLLSCVFILFVVAITIFFLSKLDTRSTREDKLKNWNAFVDEHCLEHYNRRNGWRMAYCDDGNAYVLSVHSSRTGLRYVLPQNLNTLLLGKYERVALPATVPNGIFEGMKDIDFMHFSFSNPPPRLRSIGNSWVNPPQLAKED